jgi:hypothetical protein
VVCWGYWPLAPVHVALCSDNKRLGRDSAGSVERTESRVYRIGSRLSQSGLESLSTRPECRQWKDQ